MSLTAATEPVPLATDPQGVIRVGGTRVPLDTLIAAYRRGETPEQIREAYSSLQIADVYGAIAYYLRHQEEIDAYLARRLEQARQVRQELERRFPPSGVRERLENRLRLTAVADAPIPGHRRSGVDRPGQPARRGGRPSAVPTSLTDRTST